MLPNLHVGGEHSHLGEREHGNRSGVDRYALAGDLRRGGYLRGRFPHHGNAHGEWFQTDLVLTRPGILDRAARLLAAFVPDDADRLAARGDTAVALAAAVSLQTGVPLLFAPEKEPVRFGGDAFPGARVALVEDVVLTGTHARESARALLGQDLRVTTVLALLDRSHDGRFILETDEGLTCLFAFREEDLLH